MMTTCMLLLTLLFADNTTVTKQASPAGNAVFQGGQAGVSICPEMPGHGGNIYFAPGKGGGGSVGCTNAAADEFDGDIIFMLASGKEILRLRHDGVILVRRKVVKSDAAIVLAFQYWLQAATVLLGQGKEGKILINSGQ